MIEVHSQLSKQTQKLTNIPFIEIIEQPDSVRYRYVCEGRTAGNIFGVNSLYDNKTYPTIKINGYQGKVLVIVSCVTKDKPYRPHPFKLVGGKHCKRGIFKAEINNESMTLSLQNVGIQCVKRSNVDEALKERESQRIDPFKTGYSHRDFDYNTVKLCFQAILMGAQEGQYYQLEPIVSDNIPNKKMTGLTIYRLSHASAPITGNTEIILLCDKVDKNDIEIRFFEMKNGKIIWECVADFNPSDVHKHTAICFKTPTYYLRNIENPVHVKIQLRRISDGKYGECYPFILTPDFSDFKNRKRIRLSRDSFNQCSRNPAYVSQQSIPNCTKVLTNVPYNIFESAVENIATIPENNRSSSGFFCPPLNPNVYDQFSSENKWTTPTQSTYQLTNTNSNMFCEQTKVKDQTPTDVNMDQQLNYPEILTTNQYNTFESESIKEILELPPNTSVYIKPSSTFSWTDSQIENKLLNENSNTMYGQADLYFQPNIGNSTYSANNSTVSPTLQSPEQSSQMNDIFDLLSKYPTEIDHSSNNTDISISGLSNIDDLLDDIENLSANLSSGLSI